MNKDISLNKVYKSEEIKEQPLIKFDKHYKKRPSWVKLDLDKKIIFIKLLVKRESFWYRRYFQDYFFVFEPNSEDYRNYYDAIANDYESFIPQNREMRKLIVNFLQELNIKKDAKLLDFGAGTGIVTEGIANEGYKNLTLIDISKEELKIAKNKPSLKGAKFVLVDLTKENIAGKFDVIFETMSLDYFKGEKMKGILQKIKDALTNKGKFIVIDRHIYPEFNELFKEIKKGKISLETPEGVFDYYFYIGEKT
jgi:ubiquinone/menaquinone biosynthesis C-methylase UbiE